MTSVMVSYQTERRHNKYLDLSFLHAKALLAKNDLITYYFVIVVIEFGGCYYCCFELARCSNAEQAFIKLVLDLCYYSN